jgi:hypothetical protein
MSIAVMVISFINETFQIQELQLIHNISHIPVIHMLSLMMAENFGRFVYGI